MERNETKTKKLAIVSFTPGGRNQAERICQLLENPLDGTTWHVMHSHNPKPLKDWCGHQFALADALLFVGAMGIAVRAIAPYLQHKTKDPAVLAMDEQAHHVISVLSGHIGGGNELTRQLAGLLLADPVITTASDVNHKIAVDVFAKKNGLHLSDLELSKQAAAAIVGSRPVSFSCEGKIQGTLPPELSAVPEEAEVQISVSPYRKQPKAAPADVAVLQLIPPAFLLGIGCKRGTSAAAIEQAVEEALSAQGICTESIKAAATIDLKRQETGLLEFCRTRGLPLFFYSAEELQLAPGSYHGSSFVQTVTGVDNVCERAAVLLARQENASITKEGCLVIPKQKKNGITLALAKREWSVKFE